MVASHEPRLADDRAGGQSAQRPTVGLCGEAGFCRANLALVLYELNGSTETTGGACSYKTTGMPRTDACRPWARADSGRAFESGGAKFASKPGFASDVPCVRSSDADSSCGSGAREPLSRESNPRRFGAAPDEGTSKTRDQTPPSIHFVHSRGGRRPKRRRHPSQRRPWSPRRAQGSARSQRRAAQQQRPQQASTRRARAPRARVVRHPCRRDGRRAPVHALQHQRPRRAGLAQAVP
jgi:hypothetical protein